MARGLAQPLRTVNPGRDGGHDAIRIAPLFLFRLYNFLLALRRRTALMNVADLEEKKDDALGVRIEAFYARNPPYYAVYRTFERVAVQYADAPETSAAQRKAFTQINPLRGEINGLIDGWRNPRGPLKIELRQKALRYDRRVGDALAVAFEDDIDGAVALLTEIKQAVVSERTAWARLEYVAVSLLIGALIIGGLEIAIAFPDWGIFRFADSDMLHAAATGALGAFFSIALAIKDRTVLPDFQRLANWTDAALRMVIGIIAATVLMALIKAGVVNIDLGPQGADPAKLAADAAAAVTPAAKEAAAAAIKAAAALAGLKVFIIGFIGGFSERLVPDLLAKVAAKTDVVAPTPAAAKTQPANTDAKSDTRTPAAAPGAPAAPDEDPLPEEAAHDSCACDVDLPDDEVTTDEQLPPASGGVAPVGGGAG